MGSIETDRRWKRALTHLAESIPARPRAVEELLAVGRQRQARRRWSLALAPVLVAALIILLTTVPVMAGKQTLPQWLAGRQLEQASEVWNRNTLVPLLVIKFRVSPLVVRELLAQGMRPGEVVISAEMARVAGQPLKKVAQMRLEGFGWGRIAQELGLDWQVLRRYLNSKTPSASGGALVPDCDSVSPSPADGSTTVTNRRENSEITPRDSSSTQLGSLIVPRTELKFSMTTKGDNV